MNSVEIMRILEDNGIKVEYEVLNNNYDGFLYEKAYLPKLPTLGVLVTTDKLKWGFVVENSLNDNPYDSIFSYIFDGHLDIISEFLEQDVIAQIMKG